MAPLRFLAVILGLLQTGLALDATSSDCMACTSQSDKQCLATLQEAMGELSDKSRLAFLRAVFTGSFQMASQLRQTNIDSTSTCQSLSDKECLSALDAQFDALTDKYQLAYLVESCNELQHYSAFSSVIVEGETFSSLKLSYVSGAAAVGLAAVGLAVAVKRRQHPEYAPVAEVEI